MEAIRQGLPWHHTGEREISPAIYTRRSDALSWGRVVRTPQLVATPRSVDELTAAFRNPPGQSVLAVGARRSYGDTVLNSQGGVIELTKLAGIAELDVERRVVRVQAGVTFAALLQAIVPRGLFLPVTPGTSELTVGGAIANDVHGKNHHRAGTFGRHVRRLRLVRSDGAVECGPGVNEALFAATVGGLGLTGVIEWAEIGLEAIPSSSIDCETVPFDRLDEFWALSAESEATHEHAVAWIDTLARGRSAGRGLFTRGNWSIDPPFAAHRPRRNLTIPFEPPAVLLNRLTVGLFNRAYHRLHRGRRVRTEPYAAFLYPLDAIGNWNRLYGRRGFWQYQCVIPTASMREAMPDLLGEISASGEGSFLAVLKTCGKAASPGLLSFPMEGATLAVDLRNRGERTVRLMSRLDAVVAAAGGRLYAAKDGRIPRALWETGYPRLGTFVSHVDPRCSSDFWRRVTAA